MQLKIDFIEIGKCLCLMAAIYGVWYLIHGLQLNMDEIDFIYGAV